MSTTLELLRASNATGKRIRQLPASIRPPASRFQWPLQRTLPQIMHSPGEPGQARDSGDERVVLVKPCRKPNILGAVGKGLADGLRLQLQVIQIIFHAAHHDRSQLPVRTHALLASQPLPAVKPHWTMPVMDAGFSGRYHRRMNFMKFRPRAARFNCGLAEPARLGRVAALRAQPAPRDE